MLSSMEVLSPLSPRKKKELEPKEKEPKDNKDHHQPKKELNNDTLSRKGNEKEKEALKGDPDPGVEVDTPEIQ